MAHHRMSLTQELLPLAPVVFYPAKHAPKYPIGYKAPIAFSCACILLTLAFRHLSLRDRRGKDLGNSSAEEFEEEHESNPDHENDHEKELGADTKSEVEGMPTLYNNETSK
jgi:hypothetical protein